MNKQIPDHVFRGYDLRGLVGSELDEERVEMLARGYATWLLQRRIFDCVVGYDCRLSGPSFKKAIVKGLTNSGITVYDIGMTLSQICYFAQYYFRTRGMVMITASHNPKEYNGFKFGTGFSETMLTDEIIELRDVVKSAAFTTREPKGQHIQKDIKQLYIDDLFRHVGPIRPFRVVVDACAATPGVFMPDILRQAGCEVIEQNTKPDGNFPVGTPDPTESEVQERLAKRVVSEKADLGFSYDADGDRVGIVDSEGSLIWNDVFVSICAIDVLDFLPGARIVYNTLCSKQVDEVIRNHGGIPIIWKTGHSFIKAKVKEERAAFGGELSGHFFFVDNFYGHDDGAIGTLRLLAYLTRVNKSLHQVVSELPHYVSSPEIKVGCADDVKFSIVSNRIAAQIKKLYPRAKYVEIDGVRMDRDEEMLIVRASQNGPYLTVKFEAKTQESYDQLKHQVRDILHSFPEVDFSKGVNTKALD
ncbi:phosphomannomutase/phosphoglucomutase [Patescibacteria group bacterium]|nr:phosphomannomutase/phosphoglucomutase [Patescibacteria group bacterium]MBU1473220.1 phosphomannomutase/phosphoglucomutase [Patescibacteria group bacterium]MBU2459922.1 phosphomannomutase/phosphoglucomutase [Patescibacteria group bacterium]MBU2544135.1 phosphomannomutase/phosphoglucomutase [Patescibacteria group bacterium]